MLMQSALVVYVWFCRGGKKSVRVDAVGADVDRWEMVLYESSSVYYLV